MGQHSPPGQGGDVTRAVDAGRELGWQLLEATLDAIVAVSADGLVVFANHRAEQMFGAAPGGLVRCTVESLVPERARAVRAEHRDAYRVDPRPPAMGTGRLLRGRRCDDGSEFPCEISLTYVTTAAGPLALTSIRDITGRIAAERRSTQLLELAPDATLGVDSSGQIVTANQQAERVFGYSRRDMIGQPVELLVPQRLRGGHVGRPVANAANPMAWAMGAGLTLCARRGDGAEFPCEISLATIQGADKTVVLVVVRDVSDRVERGQTVQDEEHHRALLANMLGIEERARAQIATELHDDTIQVMTAALMSLDRLGLIARRSGADDLARSVGDSRQTISAAVERTRRLMFELHPTLLHDHGLHAAVGTMVRRAGEEMDALAVSEVVEARYDWSVEELVYRTLQELVTNARKHSHAKRLNVTVSVTDATSWHDERLACSVHDDGCGFDVERVVAAGVTAFHIGMETMLERVRVAGGEVDVTSAPEHGTRIGFWVPTQPAADRIPTPAAA